MDTTIISFPIFGEDFIINAPRFVTVFGFQVYLYGLFITVGFALAALYLLKRHKVMGLTSDNILDLVIMAVPCGLIGARIYYMLFNFDQYFGPGKWRNIIMFREGGLAIYGGVIGGVVAFLIYSKIKKIHFGKLFDAAGFGLLIGQAIGRWGNFFNREAYGIETDVPWRMGLTSGGYTTYVHPTFLYEMLWNAIGLLLMHIYSKKFKRKYYGQYFLFYVAWYGFGRFLIEGLRTDSLFLGGTDIRISQLVAALSFAAAVVLLIRNYLRGVRSPEEETEVEEEEELKELELDESDDQDVELDESDDQDLELVELDESDEADEPDEADEADEDDEADEPDEAGDPDEAGEVDEPDEADEPDEPVAENV